MKKFFKSLLFLLGASAAGYFGYKGYKKVSTVIKLSKTLPDYLNNIMGEKPKININLTFKTLTIVIGVTQVILDGNSDLEATVREYIEDFYPELTKYEIVVKIEVKDTCEESSCCCDSETEDESEN